MTNGIRLVDSSEENAQEADEKSLKSSGSTNVNSPDSDPSIQDISIDQDSKRKYSLHGVTHAHVQSKHTNERFYERWFSGRSKSTAAALQSFSSRMSLASLNASAFAGGRSGGSSNAKTRAVTDTSFKKRIFFNLKQPSSTRDRYGRLPQYPTNKIRTSKYTLLTFVPKNLFEQFHRVANIYFLALIILQIFPQFNNGGNKIMPAIPIMTIVFLTAMKDAYEDYKRQKIDNDLNNKPALVLGNWRNRNKSRNAGFLSRLTKDFLCLCRFQKPLHAPDNAKSARASSNSLARVSATLAADPEMATIDNLRRSPEFSEDSAFANAPNICVTAASEENLPRLGNSRASLGRRHWIKSHQSLESNLSRKSTNFTLNDCDADSSTEPPAWKTTSWQNVHVGDFVYLKTDESIPCDVVLLSSSNEGFGAFIETKNLDGETNLKPKQSLHAFQHLCTPELCATAKFVIDCEAPTTDLYSFNACMVYSTEPDDDYDRLVANYDSQALPNKHVKTASVTIDNFLPRGTTLRNTEWAIAVAVATGSDTKVLLNSGSMPSKRSRIEVLLNPMVYMNFGILAAMCLTTVIVYAHVYDSWKDSDVNFAITTESVPVSSIVIFFNALIIYQNLVPISLYVTIEIVMSVLAWFIYEDLQMYYEPTDTRCTPKTWNVSDDLGQIEYVFSDKTGTLTCNQMEFRQCSIAGESYGALTSDDSTLELIDDDNDSIKAETCAEQSAEQMCRILDSIAANPYRLHASRLPFVDVKIASDLVASNSTLSSKIKQFWLFLALCHSLTTPMSSKESEGCIELDYKAQSPDELCLVNAAKDMGFVFLAREKKMLKVQVQGQIKLFEDLATLDFNSTRKRMSVVVRDCETNRIYLICKGADNVIYERLKKGQCLQADERRCSKDTVLAPVPAFEKPVPSHLPSLPLVAGPSNVPADDDYDSAMEIQANTLLQIEKFACDGLRTLGIAYKEMTPEVYAVFAEKYHTARTALVNRDVLVADVAEEFESQLTLLGATAIEDRLQEKVPESISQLRAAGVKVWVLTGDKIETAINIGVTCNLVSPQMNLILLKGNSYEDVCDNIKQSLERMLPQTRGSSWVNTRHSRRNVNAAIELAHALVIDGDALRTVLSDKIARKGFLVLATLCNSVICCRVSPKQKAQVVKLVKSSLNAMCLSIGDGANDVSMIHEAHVGIGIAGQEGLQAAMSSDYAIAQFRYLTRLMLVHGRWSYARMSQMIMVFWYKNIVWVFAQFWFQIFAGFSASLLYDYSLMMFYNLFFASLPGFAIGFFDKDIGEYFALNVPQLYRTGIDQRLFSFGRFWVFVADALYQSCVIFFVNYGVFNNYISPSNGRAADLMMMGSSVALNAIIIVNMYHWIHLRNWNWPAALLFFLSITACFIYLPIYVSVPNTTLAPLGNSLYSSGTFWLVLLLNIVMCLMPNLAVKYMLRMCWPQDVDVVREVEKFHLNTNHVVQAESSGIFGNAAAVHQQTGHVKRTLTMENEELQDFIHRKRSQSFMASSPPTHFSHAKGMSGEISRTGLAKVTSFDSSIVHQDYLPPAVILSQSRHSSEILPLPFIARQSLERQNSSAAIPAQQPLSSTARKSMHTRRGVSFSEAASADFSNSYFPGYRHVRSESTMNFASAAAQNPDSIRSRVLGPNDQLTTSIPEQREPSNSLRLVHFNENVSKLDKTSKNEQDPKKD